MNAAEQSYSDIKQLASSEDKLILQGRFPGINPADMFRHWVEPELLTLWWPQVAEIEPSAGGAYHLAWPDMDWHLRGVYLAFDPGRKLAFTWKWEHEEHRPSRSVVVTFRELPSGGTLMTLGHGTYGSAPEDTDERNGHLEGWIYFLGRLEQLTG